MVLTSREGRFANTMWAIHDKPSEPGDLTCSGVGSVFDPAGVYSQAYLGQCQADA